MALETCLMVAAGSDSWHIRLRATMEIVATVTRSSMGFVLRDSDGSDLGQFYNLPDTVSFVEAAQSRETLAESA